MTTCSSMGMQDTLFVLLNFEYHSIKLSPHLHYDAIPFRSVNTRILKVEMLSFNFVFNLRPFSSYGMIGVFFSLIRVYLNSIYL